MSRERALTEALRLHDSESAAFLRVAEAVPPASWVAPLAEGKWSPGHVTDHLIQAYDVLLRELSGGGGMQIRTRAWQRLLLRLTLVPRLLRGAAFPAGARAPRETRPADAPAEQAVLLARFRGHAERFHDAAKAAYAANPRQRLTHAYFGQSSLADGVLLCARHIQHHREQLGRQFEAPAAER